MQEPSSSPELQKKEMGEEEKEVEGVWSEMLALRRLYRFLHREGKDHTPSGEEKLDGTSRSLLKKLLDDATRQVIQSQDKPFSDLEAPPMATPSIPTEGATKETQHSTEHQECEPNATPGMAETVAPVLVKANDLETTEPEPAKGLDPKQVAMEIRRPTQHDDHLRHGHNRHRRHYRPSKLNLDGLPSRKVEGLLTRQHTQPNRSSHVAESGKEKRHLERNESAKAKRENGNENRHHRKAKQLAPRRSRVPRHADPIPDPERTAEMGGDGSVRGNRRARVRLAGKGRARLVGEFGDTSSRRSFDGGDSSRSNSFGSRSARGRDRVGRVPRRVSLRRVRSPSLPRGRRAASRCEPLRLQRTRPVESHSFKFRGKAREEEGKKGGRLRRLKDKLAVILHHHHYHHHHHHHHHHHRKDGESQGHHRFSRLLRKLIHRKGEERHAMEMHGEHEAERRSGGRRGHGHFRTLVQGLMQHLRRRREKRKARKEREQMLKDGAARVHGGRESKRLHWWQRVRRLGGVKLTRRRKPRLMLGPGTGRRSMPQRKLLKES